MSNRGIEGVSKTKSPFQGAFSLWNLPCPPKKIPFPLRKDFIKTSSYIFQRPLIKRSKAPQDAGRGFSPKRVRKNFTYLHPKGGGDYQSLGSIGFRIFLQRDRCILMKGGGRRECRKCLVPRERTSRGEPDETRRLCRVPSLSSAVSQFDVTIPSGAKGQNTAIPSKDAFSPGI